MSEDIAFSAGARRFSGSLKWTVEIRMRPDLTSKVIFRSRMDDYAERTAATIEELVDQLMAFAEERDITVFERKVARFLTDYLAAAGFDMNFFDLLEVLRRRREAKEKPLVDEIEELEDFEGGGLQPVWGSLIWSLEMKIKQSQPGLDDPAIMVMLINSQSGEVYKAEVAGVRDAVLAYRDFCEQAELTINERRLARLLAEYFPRLGLNPRFQEVLAYFRDPTDAIVDEVGQEIEVSELARIVELLDVPEALPSVTRVKIEEDLSHDEIVGVLDYLLDKGTPESILQIETDCHFSVDGEAHDSQVKSESEGGANLGFYEKRTTLANTFDSPMSDIKVVDVVPYDLELADYKASHDIEPTIQETPEGFSVTWLVPELKEKQEFSVDYQFLRRINRVVVLTSRDSADTITTYHSVEDAGTHGMRFKAEIPYTNTALEQIDEIHIRDIVPTDFILAQAKCKGPNDVDLTPNVTRDPEIGTQIEWIIQDFPKDFTIRTHYSLFPHPYIVLSRGSLDLDNGGKLFFARILQPVVETNEWVVTHSIEFEGHGTQNLEIVEPIPKDFSVENAFSSDPNFERQTWEIRDDEQKTIVSSFVCYPFERSTLSYRIRGESDYNPQQETISLFLDEERLSFSSNFINRTQSILSPPPEHLRALDRV
ncbi:MAG: hypothetical protein ACE5OZ_14480 [Candidatus Heimdallarchaeota archaeon]